MWSCKQCTYENRDGVSVCEICSWTKEKIWKCTACTFENSNDPIKCQICEVPRNVPKRTFQLLTATDSAQKFTEIVTQCKRNKQQYIDESFMPNADSIGILPENKRLHQPISWLRPSQIFTQEGKQYRWSLFREPVLPTDIEQGTLGNCWFMSSLSVIAERPELLRKIVLTDDYCHEGVYEIRLNIDGEWGVILVDDCFPCFTQSRSMAFSRGRRNQLWVPLIEKALAKVFGSYAALTSGQAIEGLSVLTGAPCESLFINPDKPKTPWDPDMAWATLLSSREAGFLMGCSCGRGEDIDQEIYRSVGLQSYHCYSILNVQNVDGFRLLRLRNPWGRYTWKGDWSDASSLWTPGHRALLMPHGPQEGVFWISFHDFCNYFDRVDICKIRDGWYETRVPLTYPVGFWKQGLSLPRITVLEPTELDLVLYQESFRQEARSHDRLDLAILIMKEESEGKLVFVNGCKRKTKATRSLTHFASPGTYVVVPVALKHWFDGHTRPPPKGILAIFSFRPLPEVAKKTFPATVLSDALIQMTLAKGSVLQFNQLDFCNCYYMSVDEFAGLVIVAENPHRVFSAEVRARCEGSHNVVSTRGTLHTVDSIPPRHRQIVNVLTQLEESESYSVSYSVECSRLPSMGDLLNMVGISRNHAHQHIPDIAETAMAIHGLRPIPN